jgi:hypothetical protein
VFHLHLCWATADSSHSSLAAALEGGVDTPVRPSFYISSPTKIEINDNDTNEFRLFLSFIVTPCLSVQRQHRNTAWGKRKQREIYLHLGFGNAVLFKERVGIRISS